MPRYIASHHAVARFLERFPALEPVAGRGLAAAHWLSCLACRAHVAAQQAGVDLMLCLNVPLVGGMVRNYLPVTPQGHHDTWAIRTVITEQQALANIADGTCRRHDAERAAWMKNRGDLRPFAKSARIPPRSELRGG